MTDTALSANIAQTVRRLIAKGRDILNELYRRLTKGNLVYDDRKKAPAPRAPAASALPIQFDRPSADPPSAIARGRFTW